jgi:DNA polymerase-1
VLEQRLRRVEWLPPDPRPDGSLPSPEDNEIPAPGKSMYDFYTRYWRPFGELLCDMESAGIFVHASTHLPIVEKQAEEDKKKHVEHFRSWAMSQQAAACDMNIHSATQKQHFFFAGEGVERRFSADNVEGWVDPASKNGKPKKKRDFVLQGLGLPVIETTEKKMPAVSLKVLKQLAGKMGDPEAGVAPKYGAAFDHFGGGESGAAACQAIDALCKVSAVNIMLNTFIKPLQTQTDVNGRVHCSLNLNTETGRLSSRKPNLQNQPALEKDIYKIRAAFAAAPGKKLVVADYGQLELRILAHIADCRSMITAFELGGDFHSRTAMGMYPHVAKAVEEGEVLLEWDYAKNDGRPPPLPMLKDVFGAERRKAKTLNFSIAYGKTARGLSNDWNVSLQEAEETLASWYRDRPEVKQWQEDTIANAHRFLCTRTLMGRYRPLPLINSRSKSEMKHSERAAINTPIQGGAADVVMKAMLLLHHHPRFNELGWRILLQIHDEVRTRETQTRGGMICARAPAEGMRIHFFLSSALFVRCLCLVFVG